MKTCSHCNIEKPLTEFYKNRSRKDGLQSDCKKCRKEGAAKWHAEHKEQAAKRAASYRARNPAKNKERQTKYAIDNKESIAEKAKIYRSKFRDVLNSKSKKWREANKERCCERGKKWREKNKDAIKAYFNLRKEEHREYMREWSKQQGINLTDLYVRAAVSRMSGVASGDITSELVEAKRLQLQIVRKLKELKA
jgi:hypothetical protein